MRDTISTHKRKLDVEILLRRIEKGSFVFLPEDTAGNQETATHAVGLILLDVDIPSALAQEDEDGKYLIVSQGKTLCAIMQYINGDFSLSQSALVNEIGGKSFEQLPMRLQSKLYAYTVSISTFLAPTITDEQAQSLVQSFKRINKEVA